MDQKRKILVIDNAPDRKTRIALLKERGYAVYPARNIGDAKNRCKPGAYDLIVINADDNRDAAIDLFDSIRRQAPKQLLLLMSVPGTEQPQRDSVVSSEPRDLADEVESLLKRRAPGGIALAA